MANQLAVKYSPDVVERLSTSLLTEPAVNTDYDFDGVTTVNVYSVDTQTMGNYSRTGDYRYGTLNNAGTTKQALTLSRDRAFNTTIDKRNNDEQQGVLDASKWLARQAREVIKPEIDVFRLAALGTAAAANGKDNVTTDAATTASNAYSNFLLTLDSLNNDLVPDGKVAFMTAAYRSFLKQSGFVVASPQAYADKKSGNIGEEVEGVRVIVVPSTYFPASTDLIMTHPMAMVSPMVLTDYQVHVNPPHISGTLIEGRIVYDAFVLTTLINCVAVHKTA